MYGLLFWQSKWDALLFTQRKGHSLLSLSQNGNFFPVKVSDLLILLKFLSRIAGKLIAPVKNVMRKLGEIYLAIKTLLLFSMP